ncbi:REP element-mobilizing transposase RayT [Tangfeifania diversioriginum]|uniref:REP element-mobilizing transposase RayT n=1 Tax=Tangfeifania diversioriginum TaxID=1168035 RepID=A0A1M6EUQ4_9BACT|nr:transposase [Tangfeifania diversioriginum]SHI89158.1 REP element-mobilizing transposase RayT [Tangfeifania diversioriginum]
MPERDQIYHVYNQGNNRQKIFFNRDNYLFFLHKIRKHIFPYCEILAYCLMPNHFHLMIYTTEKSELVTRYQNDAEVSVFSDNLRIMLSSYTRAINKQENKSGSLFRQNTKMKNLTEIKSDHISLPTSLGYDFYCFHYIHQNPVVAGFVANPEEWEFSSYNDYIGKRNGTLVNKKLTLEILDLNVDEIKNQTNYFIDERLIDLFES